MEDTSDELSKLEELMAADSSDDDAASSKRSISIERSERSLFLQEEVEKENDTFVLKRSTKSYSIKEYQNNEETKELKNNSLVHTGDTDSSDDEDKKNFLERKYTDYGSDVKKLLQVSNVSKEYVKNDTKTISFRKNRGPLPTEKLPPTKDIYTDPVFGLRIVKPLISSSVLLERMQGRVAVSVSRVKGHVGRGGEQDWVLAGVVVRKSASKESLKGAHYSIWTLSDLKDDFKTVSLFLFRNAYKQLWKTNTGTVVGVLNPGVLDKKDDSKDEACLSVDNHEKVMVFGNSKDFGYCKSKKKNGDPCASFVNTNQCEYCVYHVKQEYQKCSKRTDLQSSTASRGLIDLRNKVLGKNTYIYGGQAFSAIPAVKCKKQTAKDNNRLQTLSDYFKTSEPRFDNKSSIAVPMKKTATRVDVSRSQRLKDLERLEFLSAGSSANVNSNTSPKQPAAVSKVTPLSDKPKAQSQIVLKDSQITELKLKCPTLGIPMLGFGLKTESMIDLTLPFSKKQSDKAKSNALKWIKQNGPLNQCNPNNVRGTTEGKKRNLEKLNISGENQSNIVNDQINKKIKTGITSEHFKKMLAATSAHTDLILQHDDTEADKYFNKLEKKEQMEEKMLNTYKVACKAVKCLKCSYTSFSAADRCKEERHPLKVFDATKRFFKCSHCGHRLVSLEVIPTRACPQCRGSGWRRTGMMAERKAVTLASSLSISGGEDFLGHVDPGSSINLLVPEDGT